MSELSPIRCVLCGTGLELTQGIDDDGVRWTRQRCHCGRTDMLHIDKGKLDLESIDPAAVSEYEIFEPRWPDDFRGWGSNVKPKKAR